MTNKKTKKKVVALLAFTIILPIIWLVFFNLVIDKSNFIRDVYLDKNSIEILGDNDVLISFNLKNTSDFDYGGKFLHICPVKDGRYGSSYFDYELAFIGSGQTIQILISTEFSKEDIDDIKVQVRDDTNSGFYTSLNESESFSIIPKIISYICCGIVITACVLMFNKAIVLQLQK